MTIRKTSGKGASLKTKSPAVKSSKAAPVAAGKTAKPAPKKAAPAVKQNEMKPVAKPASKAPQGNKFQKIKTILLRQRAALLNEAEVALNELPVVTLFPDMGDQASAETDMNFMLRLRGREQRLLKKIDEALERIDNGTFGICDDCGYEIDLKRLEARPVTNMCIECKTIQEEEEKRREV
jgi:DnaK suppressor protein